MERNRFLIYFGFRGACDFCIHLVALNAITYDSDLRPTSITVPGIESLAFTYDAANRITGITNGMDGTQSETLGYDALNRLTTETGGAENESYQYDADGNRTYQVANGTPATFNYAATSNRLMSVSDGTVYGHNADGDLTTVDNLTTYQYGPFDRLSNAGGYAYENSAEGQRIAKSGGGNTTYFAPGAGGALLAEDDNGTWYDYVWLNGRLIGLTVNGGVFSIHDDQTGRPQVMTAPNTGSIVWEADNFPFKRNVTVNSYGNFNIGFPGQYYDSESGLFHNGSRDYNPLIGRYIESDPIGLAGGVNTYAYVGNNPISSVDPLGLCPSKKCQNALAAAGANAAALDRAIANMPALDVAASEFGIAPALLGAIGIRESGFRNVAQSGGAGRGVFQIDLGENPTMTAGEAGNVWASSEYAAAELSANMATLGGEYPNFTPGQLLQATAASYNLGVGGISGNPSTIDVGSPGNNYGSNVIGLMSCFENP